MCLMTTDGDTEHRHRPSKLPYAPSQCPPLNHFLISVTSSSLGQFQNFMQMESFSVINLCLKRCVFFLNIALDLCTYFLRLIYLFLEKVEERKKNIDVWENHWLVASHMPPTRDLTLTTQACALTGDRNGDLSVCRTPPYPLSHTSQGNMCLKLNVTNIRAPLRVWWLDFKKKAVWY